MVRGTKGTGVLVRCTNTRQERDGEEGATPGGKTLCKRDPGCAVGSTVWTGQSGRMIFKTIPAFPDDSKA